MWGNEDPKVTRAMRGPAAVQDQSGQLDAMASLESRAEQGNGEDQELQGQLGTKEKRARQAAEESKGDPGTPD